MTKIISIKYDVPNDRLEMFDDYMKMIDGFYDRSWNGTRKGGRSIWQLNI